MQIHETKNEGLLREYRIALPAAEIRRKLDDRLLELSRTLRLPGFRPGKVPMAVVTKRFAASVKSEVLEQAISESSQALIEERQLRTAGAPKLEIESYADDGDLEYTLAVEVLPEIVPPDYAQIRLERLVVDVDEADVTKTLDHLARSSRTFSEVTEPRPARAGDQAIIDFVGPADRKAFVGAQGEGVSIEVGPGSPIPGLGEQLEGIAVGEQRTIEVAFPDDYAIEDMSGRTVTYDIVVKGLKEADPVPVDDALANRFGLDTLDALRVEIREERVRELKRLSRMRLKRSLLDRLAELYAFELPTQLVKQEYDNIVRQLAREAKGNEHDHEHDHACDHEHDHEHDDHHGHAHDPARGHAHGHDHDHDHAAAVAVEVESQATEGGGRLPETQEAEYRALAERRVRLGLVLAEIGRTNQIRVTTDELSRAVVAEARRYSGQEQAVLDYFRKHPQAREALAAPVLEDKVVDFVLEMAKVDERTVPFEELLRDLDDGPMSAKE